LVNKFYRHEVVVVSVMEMRARGPVDRVWRPCLEVTLTTEVKSAQCSQNYFAQRINCRKNKKFFGKNEHYFG
jgi:hypothetical protein